MLIDTHCHLHSLSRVTQGSVLAALGTTHWLLDSSIDETTSRMSVELSSRCNFLYTSLGFHPFSVEGFSSSTLSTYEALIENNPKVVAIGEIGLDYKALAPKEKQEEIFRVFLAVARRYEKPVCIHIRSDTDAGYARLLEILDEFYEMYDTVIFHCYSHTPQFLETIAAQGAFISFSLNIMRRSEKILASVAACPAGQLLLETDSPYMKVGDRNSTPFDLAKVYERASQLRSVSVKELEEQVFENAKRAFGIGG